MSDSFAWRCPYCNHNATIGPANYSTATHYFENGNREGKVALRSMVTVCPNPDCKQFEMSAALFRWHYNNQQTIFGPPLMRWPLHPQSKAKPFPDYIPQQIRDDYLEACLIRDLSPKASATLSRRALQGIIRGFWGVSKPRLVDEINAIKDKIDQSTWDAIDAVRSIGNIGAHMERDIDVIIDVEPAEAEMLIGLIELVLTDWYVARHERQQRLAEIVAVAAAKKVAQQKADSAAQ